MQIKLKRLSLDTKTPTKAHSTDACFDIYCDLGKNTAMNIQPGETVKIKTGFATEIPEGYYCEVYARSGMGINKGLRPANCVGIIDSDYRGEWVVALHNDSDTMHTIYHGDRIAQFAVKEVIPCTIEVVEELSNTDRGDGGFGSTGQ